MKLFNILILSFFFLNTSAQTWNWAKSITNNGPDAGTDIVYDGHNNLYVAANFYTYFGNVVVQDSTISKNGLIKYSKTGDIIWAKNINGVIKKIAVDTIGNVYIVGVYTDTARFGDSTFVSLGQTDIFVSKINSLGQFIWSNRIEGSGYDEACGIAVGLDSNIAISGFTGSSAIINDSIISTLGGGILLAKYTSNGEFMWASQKGFNVKATDIKIANNNTIFVSGWFSFYSDFGGSNQIVGNGNNSALFIANYDSVGNFNWVHTGISGGNNYALSLALDNSNNAYLTGYFADTVDFGGNVSLMSNTSFEDVFIAKYNSVGQLQWAKRDGDYYTDISNSIALYGNYIFVTGVWDNDMSSSTSSNVMVKVFDTNGDFVSNEPVLCTTIKGGSNAICIDDDGNAYVTGQFKETITFNNSIALTSYTPNDYDFFVTQFTPTYVQSGIQFISKSTDLKVYPNPTSGKIQIQSLGFTIQRLEISNLLGEVVFSQVETLSKSEIDLSSQPVGVYFVKITDGEKMYTQKIVIQ